MRTVIESINFEPNKTLSDFIIQTSKAFNNIDSEVLFAEFNLSIKKGDHICTLVLVISGKNLVVTKQSTKMYLAVLDAITYTISYLQIKKLKENKHSSRKIINLNSYYRPDDSLFLFSAN